MTTTARVTWAAASARRLERQFLTTAARQGTPVTEVVGAMLGAHAQVLSAAELSVGLRTAGVTRSDVRAALREGEAGEAGEARYAAERTAGEARARARYAAERTVEVAPPAPPTAEARLSARLVKTFGPRGTVHLLPAAELPLWSAALSAVPSGPNPFRPDARLTDEQAEQVVAAIGEALEGACLTADELTEEIVVRTGPWAGDLVMPAFQGWWPRWRQVLHRAGQTGALCFGPDRGRKVTYTRPPHFTPLPPEQALRTLVRRYLYSYGPARPQHFARWLATGATWATALFEKLAADGEIEETVFENERAWVAAGDHDFPENPRERQRGVRLLPYFDAYAIAAQPRERLFPGAASDRALAGGQAGNYPVLLVDGVVAGVWHQRRRGRRTTLTVEPLGDLTAHQQRQLADQAERVGEVLEATAELVVGEVTVGPHA
ncbi:winged helix DNA-binding domain-containing protein [Streptomyces poriticola]|uniref:winged helix DNA-binding domain-containing protein n=1 Tax=Streptomyces poriticola TaxID=3120506 RepID=UPI002FCDFBF8